MLPANGAGRIETSEQTTTAEPDPDPVSKRGITICVDPGHGFEDGGTSHEFLGEVLEKDITFSVANKLKGYLEELGFDVIMTHDGKEFPVTANDDGNSRFRPEERVSYANSLGDKIDYYVSVHCNAFDTSDVSGAIVFYVEDATKGTIGDAEAAETLKNRLSADFADYRVSANVFPYYVIRYTHVPASLIEMGYVTNENDAKNMLDDEWQSKFAKSIADGLDEFYSDDTDDTAEGSADAEDGV